MSKLNPREERVLKQIKAWVDGRAIHNHQDDECTPDFSCCRPHLMQKDRRSRMNYFNMCIELNKAEPRAYTWARGQTPYPPASPAPRGV